MPTKSQKPRALMQLIPVTEEGEPWAFYGLDSSGRVWFGVLDGLHVDGGHVEIKWRPVDAR